MTSNSNFARYKQKKELIEELNVYQSFVLKKIDIEDFKSALTKIDSALTLIDEFQSYFDLKPELKEFSEIRQKVLVEFDSYRNIYVRRYNNLLKESLTETNLEDFLKLLAMLKNEVDDNLNKYNLYDLQDNIITYFIFIKKLYTIISSYKVLNYNDASGKIIKFVKDYKVDNYPNLKDLVSIIYQNLLFIQFKIMSENYDKLSLREISQMLLIAPERVENLINLIINKQKSPIKKYTKYNNEVIFNK
jgi:phosphopantetheine adenylyltransferase